MGCITSEFVSTSAITNVSTSAPTSALTNVSTSALTNVSTNVSTSAPTSALTNVSTNAPTSALTNVSTNAPEGNPTWADTIPFIPPVTAGFVIKVYDGDTITVAARLPYADSPLYRFPVRLRGIDSPEIRGKTPAERAAAVAARDAFRKTKK